MVDLTDRIALQNQSQLRILISYAYEGDNRNATIVLIRLHKVLVSKESRRLLIPSWHQPQEITLRQIIKSGSSRQISEIMAPTIAHFQHLQFTPYLQLTSQHTKTSI